MEENFPMFPFLAPQSVGPPFSIPWILMLWCVALGRHMKLLSVSVTPEQYIKVFQYQMDHLIIIFGFELNMGPVKYNILVSYQRKCRCMGVGGGRFNLEFSWWYLFGALMGITRCPLPQKNDNLPLPFFVVYTLSFSWIIFMNNCIYIFSGSLR